jgi:hypothetical protein
LKAVQTPQVWKKCFYNAIFIKYRQESQSRKRNRSGKEEDEEDIETHQQHIQRDTNHINHGIMSDCLACQGFKQGQIQLLKRRGRKYLQPTSGNAQSSHHGSGGQTKYGCTICEVLIYSTQNCWDFYHHMK